MLHFQKYLLYILIFINVWQCFLCLRVTLRKSNEAEVEGLKTQIHKRDMALFFDKASYSFKGVEKIESVPVLFPMDLCLMNLKGIRYAASLHKNKDGVQHFGVYKMNNGNYVQLADIATPKAIAMDCKEIGSKGYVALAYNLTTPIESAREGSPIFEIAGDYLREVQFFPTTNLVSVYLRVSGNDLFLLQTLENTRATPHLACPHYWWTGSTFNKLGAIPCSNARQLEPFEIDYETYVAVANYADQHGRTATNSEIYKYDRGQKEFRLIQKIKTNGAVDVKYFSVPVDETRRQHFLVFGNSLSSERTYDEDRNLEADSVFYMYDKGQFTPYQSLSFYAVKQFLPVQNSDSEKFLMLVACDNQDIKIYNLNDWKFEESDTQFTEGALSRGVANMRIYEENDASYLVIANELMSANETNIFLPIFKQDEHANALRQEIIDWTKSNIARLENIDVEELRRNVEQRISQEKQQVPVTTSVMDIPTANIQSVNTNLLIYPKLHLSTNYWKALSFAKQALDALQSQYMPSNRQKRASSENQELNFEELEVGTLVVRNKIKAERVNGVKTVRPEFESIAAEQIVVTGSYSAPNDIQNQARLSVDDMPEATDAIVVDNLEVTGKLNEFTWNELINGTLKRTGQQFLKAAATISNLQAESVVVTGNEIDGNVLSKLVSINDGDYVVDQDVQFAAPVQAKDVLIHERLNNIHVVQNKFDVLLKRSNETQIVEGAKRFENVKVLQPISLSGQPVGKHLNSISPTKAIHENVALNGDFTIFGDVTISRLLSTSDIIVAESDASVSDVLQRGVRLDGTVEDVNLKFLQALDVNHSVVSFINAQDMQQLIKTNTNEIQVLDGEKIFGQTLEIHEGFCEGKNLNGINVAQLERSLLLKHTNQTVTAPIHFGKILAKGVQATNITLQNQALNNFLTKSGNETIQGALKTDRLSAETVNLEYLNTNGDIFDEKVEHIYQQKAKSAPNTDVFHKQRKFHGTIYVKNLRLNNSTINGKPADKIERQLTQLGGNIKYVGNYKFNYDMNVANLTFYGKLNGIPAPEFGKCWLQKQGAQNFTVPQTFAGVKSNRGIQLAGKLNGHNLEDFYSKTYWINRNEYIPNAVFQNPIQMQGVLSSQTVNGVRVPQDVLYRSGSAPQILYANSIVQGDLLVKGRIQNTTIVNGINLYELQRYVDGYGADTLYLENAQFDHAPAYTTLNQHDLKQTLDAVWLANENVDLPQHVEIHEGYFEGLLEFEGPINNVNLKHLQENYFSISRPQRVNTELVFENNVQFNSDANTGEVQLAGPIIESNSNTSFDFNDFVLHTVKTAGSHIISGEWSIDEASVAGDMHEILINELNLVDDVLHASAPFTNITAPKQMSSATIKKLIASPMSTVGEVPVSSWIRDTVFVYGNHTIQGTTTIDTVNLYNDLCVHGQVNNIAFNEQTLLLRDYDQTIHGDVIVRNKFPAEQRILANNFENLNALMVNGVNVDRFLANQAMAAPALQVHGHLTFTKSVLVGQYSNGNGETDELKWKRDALAYNRTLEDWQMLENAVRKLKTSIEAPCYVLDHFEVRQIMPVKTTKLIPMTLRLEKDLVDIIGVLNETTEDLLKFYLWQTVEQQFVLDNNLSQLPQDKTLINIIKLAFDNVNYQTVEQTREDAFYQNIISSNSKDLLEVLQLKDQQAAQIQGFRMHGENCLAIYGNQSSEVYIYCLKLGQETPNVKIYQKDVLHIENVKQILPISNVTIALLLADALEIWNTEESMKSIQRIPLLRPTQMSLGHRGPITYLALISESKPKTLHRGAVEIFRSLNASTFAHLQTLDCIDPLELAFSHIGPSDDLLLDILTAASDRPLVIYQFKGVMGFQNIVGASTLPVAQHMQIVELKAAKQHLIALMGEEEVTFVEAVLKKF